MKRIAWLFPVLAGVLWGTCGVFVRGLISIGFDNLTITSTRAMFSAVMMLTAIALFDRSLLRINIKDLWIFVIGGLIGILCLNVSYNYAVTMLSLSVAAVLINLAPVAVVILAAILFHERLTGRKILCLILAILGGALTSGIFEAGAADNVSLVGVLICIWALFVRAVYSLISRVAIERGYHPLTMTFYCIAIIAILTAPFCDWKHVIMITRQQPYEAWLLMIGQSLCLSALPYFLYNLSLLYIDVGTTAILSAIEPVAAMVIGIIVYSEYPTVLSFAGLLFALASLVLINSRNQ